MLNIIILFFFNCINIYNFNESTRGYTNNFGDFKLENCFFIRSNSLTLYGGVIYIKSLDCNFTLIDCIFENCSSLGGSIADGGGAIYFNSQTINSNVFFKNICANNCWTISSSGWNQFCVLCLRNNINNQIQVFLTSITKCSPFMGHGYTAFLTFYANQTISNFNSSINRNYAYSGIWNRAPNKLRGTFYNLFNNTVSGFTCLLLSESSADNLISYSNIVKCNGPSYGVVRLWSSGIFYLSDFVFLNNTNILFYVDNGQLIVKNSFFYHLSTSILTGSVTTQSLQNIITETFHLSTYLCNNNFLFFKNTNIFRRIIFRGIFFMNIFWE